MLWRQRMCLQPLVDIGLVLFCLLVIAVIATPPACADLRLHHDAPGQVHYHSQQSLSDQWGHAWQVVLFRQFPSGESVGMNLRLVGFPGLVELARAQPLEIVTRTGRLLTATDVFGETAPAPNVGEYNFTNVLPKLEKGDRLQLYIPVNGKQPLYLEIPPALVTEWQWLADNI